MIKRIYVVIALSVLFCSNLHCTKHEDYSSLSPVHRLESYRLDATSEIVERIGCAPDFVLKHLGELDNNPRYVSLPLNKASHVATERAIALLPAFIKQTLKERLLGIYFIDHFQGSGLSEWVVDRSGRVYAFMAFNQRVLEMDASELVTWRERTCFKKEGKDSVIQITCGNSLSGISYILLHESFHVYDYVHQVTPYCDTGIKDYFTLSLAETDFTKSVWKYFDEPVHQLSFSGKLHFYGFGKPLLNSDDAEIVYEELFRSPFLSLYGSSSWSEDFAEFGAFYHITEIMKQHYFIELSQDLRRIKKYEPAQFIEVRKRFVKIRSLY